MPIQRPARHALAIIRCEGSADFHSFCTCSATRVRHIYELLRGDFTRWYPGILLASTQF